MGAAAMALAPMVLAHFNKARRSMATVGQPGTLYTPLATVSRGWAMEAWTWAIEVIFMVVAGKNF